MLKTIFAVLLSHSAPTSICGIEPDREPNIVIVYIDDMGWNDLGCTGSKTIDTPNLDAMADGGLLFEQAYANAPNCAPSRACLMSGQYTPRHGVYTVGDPRGRTPERNRLVPIENTQEMAQEVITLADMLSRRGYATSCIGKWNLGQGTDRPHSPTGQGFDEFRHYKALGFTDGYFDARGRYSTDVLFDEAIAFIERNGEAPFFLYLAPDAVHEPAEAPDRLTEKYRRLGSSNPEYAAMVETVDDGMGRLVSRLKRLGLEDDTMVIFTSDNGGTSLPTAPLKGRKGSLYEGGIRVPLIIRGAGIDTPGRRIETPVIATDFYTTILDLIDATPQPGQILDGTSLMPLFRGGATLDRDALFWHFPAYIGGNTPSGAVRSGRYKAITFFEDDRLELYDLSTDPGEQRDLARSRPDLAQAMRTKLENWHSAVGAPIPSEPNPTFNAMADDKPGGDRAMRGERGRRGGRGGRGARGDGNRDESRAAGPPSGDRTPWPIAHAEELDQNGDGRVEEAEMLAEAEATCRAYDSDGDGRITRLERDGLTPQRPMGGFVKENANKIDRDGDDVITCEELAATTRRMFERAAGAAGFIPVDGNPANVVREGDETRSSTGPAPSQAESFRHFDDVTVSWDDQYIYVESDGMPEHPMMVGITAWNRQVPIPHAYRGDNAFRIPRTPRPGLEPTPLPYIGPVAVAVNGVPIFNPIKQDGRSDTFTHGELDEFGGHAGRGDDYHYHILPDHLEKTVGLGRPVAWSMDGFPIIGPKERSGRAAGDLDESHGHAHGSTGYHYHGSNAFPYIHASFHGEYDDTHQPKARGVRPHTQPLRGAEITGFEHHDEDSWTLIYQRSGREHAMHWSVEEDGSVTYQLDDGPEERFERERGRNPEQEDRTQAPTDDRSRRGDRGDGRDRNRDRERGGTRGERQDPPNNAGQSPSSRKPTLDDALKVNVYADNTFTLYINGELVATDPIKFVPHNVVSVEYLPTYPMTIAVLAEDNADPETGMEYADTAIGDGGFILKFSDGTVTDGTWKARRFSWGPLNADTRRPRVRSNPMPKDWFEIDFDDDDWDDATVFTEDQVDPKQVFHEHDFEGASFIWTEDLSLDNTVVFRKHVASPPDGRQRRDFTNLNNETPQGGLRKDGIRNSRPDSPPSARSDRNRVGQPNIILLLSDDQGWNGLSVPMDPGDPDSGSSYVRTPHLAELAKEGMTLPNAYAPAPVCSPSRASIQTGRSPGQLRWTKAARPFTAADGFPLIPPSTERSLETGETTIGEIMKGSGYTTAHFGKWHLSGGGPGVHGYDVHDGDTSNDDAAPHVAPNPVDIMGMTERAEAFIDESVETNTPFYLQMSYHALHYPQNASPELIEYYKNDAGRRNEKEIQKAAMAEELDIGVGRLLDHLDALGIADDTYVIYMSDNGSGGQGRVLRGGKGGIWEGGIRVPCIIRGPGIIPGTASRIRITGIDLLPTFAAIGRSEAELPDGLEGGDFMPALTGETDSVARSQDFLTFHFPHYQGQDGPQSALIMGDMKLVKLYETDTVQLFDLANDPGENRDLADARPEETRHLRRLLEAHLERIEASLPTSNPQVAPEDERPARNGDKKGEGRKNRGTGREGRGTR